MCIGQVQRDAIFSIKDDPVRGVVVRRWSEDARWRHDWRVRWIEMCRIEVSHEAGLGMGKRHIQQPHSRGKCEPTCYVPSLLNIGGVDLGGRRIIKNNTTEG